MSGPTVGSWSRSFGNLAVGEFVASALRFFTLLIVARRLEPVAFGIVSVGVVVGGYLVILAQPGLEVTGTRRIAGDSSNGSTLLAKIVGLRFLLAALAFPLAVLVTVALPLDSDTSTVIIVFGLLIFTQGLDVKWAFVGIQRTFPVAAASVIGAVVYLGAVLALVHDSGDILWAALVHVGAQVVIVVVLIVTSVRVFGRWRPRVVRGVEMRTMLGESIPITLAQIARAATVSVDVLFVRAFRPAEDVGLYAAASRLMIVGLVYIGIYYGTLLPTLVRVAAEGRTPFVHLLRSTLRRTFFAGTAIAIVCIALVPLVLPVVFGDEYRGAVPLLQVLIVALLLVGFSGLINHGLIALGRERAYGQLMVVGLVVNVVANLALLPTIGTVGAAIATVMAEVVVLAGGLLLLRSAIATMPTPAVASRELP